MRYLYNFILFLALPLILLRLIWKSRKSPQYRQRWSERFAFIKPIKTSQSIWVHAVSFGESVAATPLINALLQQYPNYTVVVTTMTITGSQQIQKTFGEQIYHVYIPYDYPNVVKRFLNRTKPVIAIIMETELWPNILYYCHQRNIPVLIANARLSPNSAIAYKRLGKFTQQLMQHITLVAAQSELDAQRFITLGLKPERAVIAGNIKFDVTPPADILMQGEKLRTTLGKNRPVWIAASTHPGEEEIILQAFSQIRKTLKNALLILVPRHPERFDAVAALCQQHNYIVSRRSTNNSNQENCDIFLGDTMGEMWLFYAASDVAFVGGSFVAIGGHNLLEPAALGVAIISGPQLFNFLKVSQLLLEKQALTVVNNENELADAVLLLLQNETLRKQQGESAKQVVNQNRGALKRHLELIAEQIPMSS